MATHDAALFHLWNAVVCASMSFCISMYFKLRAIPRLPSAESIADVVARVMNGDNADDTVVVSGNVSITDGGVASLFARNETVTTITDSAGRAVLLFESPSILPKGHRSWCLNDETGRALPANNCAEPRRVSAAELDTITAGVRRRTGSIWGAATLLDAIFGTASRDTMAPTPSLLLLEGLGRVPRPLVDGERLILVGRPILPDGCTTLFIHGWAFSAELQSNAKWGLSPVTLLLLLEYATRHPEWVAAMALAGLSLDALVRALLVLWFERPARRPARAD